MSGVTHATDTDAGRSGVLLINLGTPQAATPAALRSYLKEFLRDPRVVTLPRLLWWPILHLWVLNTRPKKSAEKYARIWLAEGSPLKVHTERQAKLLRGYLGQDGRSDIVIEWAMRYGTPSVASALDRLGQAGCSRILILPLYPQRSFTTTDSALDAVSAWQRHRQAAPRIDTLEEFHLEAGYLAALAASIRRHWMDYGRPQKLVMSFHGLPRRSIEAGDPYHAHCLGTARALARELALREEDFVVAFQSRFGGGKWLQPATQGTLESLAREGVRHVDVICPGFVSDCLETLEEIAIEAKAAFLAAGGKEFRLIPCLNERHEWLAALAGLIDERLRGPR